MAATVARITEPRNVGGGVVETLHTVTLDSSYATGGEAVSANSLGLGTVIHASVGCNAGYVGEYDISNAKLKAYWVDTTTDGAPMAEVATTTDLGSVVFRVRAVGRP